jgi:hypothetical protein
MSYFSTGQKLRRGQDFPALIILPAPRPMASCIDDSETSLVAARRFFHAAKFCGIRDPGANAQKLRRLHRIEY